MVTMVHGNQSSKKWLRRCIDLPNITPSYAIFNRVFAYITPKAFLKCFMAWTSESSMLMANKMFAISGKTLRRFDDKASDKSAIHFVSAWVSEL